MAEFLYAPCCVLLNILTLYDLLNGSCPLQKCLLVKRVIHSGNNYMVSHNRYTCLIIELEHHIANPFCYKIEEVVKKLKYPQPVPIKCCLCILNFNWEVALSLESSSIVLVDLRVILPSHRFLIG